MNVFLDSLQWDDKTQAPLPNISKILCDQTFQIYSFQHRQFFKSNSSRDLVAVCRTDTMNLLVPTTTESHLELDLEFERYFFSVCHQLSLHCYCSLEADNTRRDPGQEVITAKTHVESGQVSHCSSTVIIQASPLHCDLYQPARRPCVINWLTTSFLAARMVRLENVEKYTGWRKRRSKRKA